MPLDHVKAQENWLRYVYLRDSAHIPYVRKADKCEDFVAGRQWDPSDKAAVEAGGRPAVTINKTLITLNSIVGEQIETRNEISFRPKSGAPPKNSEMLTKVFKFIGTQNQLDWVRTGVFADGAVTSRGYYDVRLDFAKNMAGEVAITQLNPRNVLPDSDASAYDPDRWNDVIVTGWFTGDDIEMLYNKADADALRRRTESSWAYGYDSLDNAASNDRFGGNVAYDSNVTPEMRAMMRNIRVIERQHRVLTRQEVFIDVRTGDKRPVPEGWGRDEIARFLAENPHLVTTKDMVKRIRWTVTADDFVLMDEWSPYRHFTVVPYFPHFRYGRTVGLIEGLLDPQEVLNKTISQELHVVNTMANSGWKVKQGAVMNMTMEELEEIGSKTGLVIEVAGDPDTDVVKIQPNQIPTGLDRISFKAEGFIKTISGRGDSVMGLDRADVSAKAIGEKKSSADVPLRPAMDNLERTDWLMARNVVDIVQQFYTDPRIMSITSDDLTGEMETVEINQPQPGSGEVMNDMSLGEHTVVVTSQAAKRTLEESQFEQALAMRELGIPIPERFLIENSNLVKKAEILKKMDEDANSEASQIREKSDLLSRQLEVANLKADAEATGAKAVAARAKAAKDIQEAQAAAGGQDAEMIRDQQKHEQEMTMMREKHALEMQIKQEEMQLEMQLKRAEAAEKAKQQKLQTVIAAKNAAATPASVDEAAKLAKAGGGMQAGAAGKGGAGRPQAQSSAP